NSSSPATRFNQRRVPAIRESDVLYRCLQISQKLNAFLNHLNQIGCRDSQVVEIRGRSDLFAG
ncbi:hypothetical protein LINGRAHAP2_LOCUS30890, partial [Linum grandiflorum]